MAVSAAGASRRRRFHWNRYKARLVRGAERVGASLPGPVANALLRAGKLLALAAYFLPGVPLRGACHDLSRLAAERGVVQRPFAIYRRLLSQMYGAARLYHRLHRDGRDAVLACMPMRAEEQRILSTLFEQDGAFVIAVPHNPGAVLYAMRLAAQFPCVVVGKHSKRPGSDALMQRLFERMGVPLLLASRHERVAFTRRLLEAVEEGRAIIAPMDRIDRRGEGELACIFGREARFPAWALRVAARRELPLLPAWLTVERSEIHLELGAPIRETDPARALQEVVRCFEDWILRDPGSWAFLADKRWSRLLRETRSV